MLRMDKYRDNDRIVSESENCNDWQDHPDLDDIPRKTIGQQVEDYIEMGERLEASRREFLLEPDYGDVQDVDDLDTGLDEYSDLEDRRRGAIRASSIVKAAKGTRKPSAPAPAPGSAAPEAPAGSDSPKPAPAPAGA